jgi:transporter family protein
MQSNFPKWLIYSLLAVFTWGVFGFFSKLGSKELSPTQLQSVFSVGIVAMSIPAWFRAKINRNSNKLGLFCGFCTGFLSVAANLAVFAALQSGKASLVQPVTGLYPLVTVVLAATVLKERLKTIQGGGVAVAVLALWILSS